MRITGGKYRSRQMSVPPGDAVRPTQDRVREALFSMLAFDIPGSRFLDLFAGSGAVGLEALSRGAAFSMFVEANARHIACLEKNIVALGVERACYSVERGDVFTFLDSATTRPFDIVFADPPYALAEEKGLVGMMEALAARGILRKGGLFIAETAATDAVAASPAKEFSFVKSRDYGKTRLNVFRHDSEEPEK